MSLMSLTAVALGKKVQAGEVTVEEAVLDALEQIEKKEDTIHSYVTVLEKETILEKKHPNEKILGTALLNAAENQLISVLWNHKCGDDKIYKEVRNAAKDKADAAELTLKTVKKETTETMAEATKTPRKMTKVSDTVLEIFETKVSMKDLEAVIKKEVKANGLKGEIKIYLNAEQRAAYYTVDGQGSDDFKVDLTTLAE